MCERVVELSVAAPVEAESLGLAQRRPGWAPHRTSWRKPPRSGNEPDRWFLPADDCGDRAHAGDRQQRRVAVAEARSDPAPQLGDLGAQRLETVRGGAGRSRPQDFPHRGVSNSFVWRRLETHARPPSAAKRSPSNRQEDLQVGVEAVAHPGLFGLQLVAVVDEQLRARNLTPDVSAQRDASPPAPPGQRPRTERGHCRQGRRPARADRRRAHRAGP